MFLDSKVMLSVAGVPNKTENASATQSDASETKAEERQQDANEETGQSNENVEEEHGESVENDKQQNNSSENVAQLPSAEDLTATIFSFCDSDGNGALTKEEFINGGLKDPNLMEFLTGCAGR